MDKLKKAFKGKKANIGYIVAGYPSMKYTKDFLELLDESALDVLEIGVPYQDPLADGSVIAKASFSAAKDGINLDDIFKLLNSVGAKDRIKTPLVFLIYFNSILAYGTESFMHKCKQAGISALIVPDLPFEESSELEGLCQQAGIALIMLLSVTSKERLKHAAKARAGFVYLVGAIGVSGSKKASKARLSQCAKEIKKYTKLPVAVGFGVKNAKDVKAVQQYADAAIIGTQIVKASAELSPKMLVNFIKELFMPN